MAQMRALETPDPFNDDFYYHNAMRRKQEKSQRAALAGQEPNVRVRKERATRCVGRAGIDSGDRSWCFVVDTPVLSCLVLSCLLEVSSTYFGRSSGWGRKKLCGAFPGRGCLVPPLNVLLLIACCRDEDAKRGAKCVGMLRAASTAAAGLCRSSQAPFHFMLDVSCVMCHVSSEVSTHTNAACTMVSCLSADPKRRSPGTQAAAAPPMPMPLPVWQETKEIAKKASLAAFALFVYVFEESCFKTS